MPNMPVQPSDPDDAAEPDDPTASAELGQQGVRRAYDTVAADYAALLPDTRAESPLELAMLNAFADAVAATAGTAGTSPTAGTDGPHPDAPVLDAGCGAGRMTRYLADRGCDVRGVDLSPGMVEMACRAHPDLEFTVASLTDLPFPDDHFAGVVLWYSAIHTPPPGQPRVFAEVSRVLRPGGHLVVAFQSGEGVRDVSEAYRKYGHEVRLERFLHTADQVAAHLTGAGLVEVARMVRRARGPERDDQAVLLARAG